MLDLVVQPAVHEIVRIAASLEVRGADHRAEVEIIRTRLRFRLESVDVVADVVGGDDDERVNVRHNVREDGSHEPGERSLRAADGVANRRQCGERPERVWSEALDGFRHSSKLALERALSDRENG